MNVEALNPQGTTGQKITVPEQVSSQRKEKEKVADNPQSAPAEKKVQSEELLDQIKSLTQDGLYSVRFESDDTSSLIVKIFDNESQEVIRQIPAEEMLNFKATFQELLGNIVDTKG